MANLVDIICFLPQLKIKLKKKKTLVKIQGESSNGPGKKSRSKATSRVCDSINSNETFSNAID